MSTVPGLGLRCLWCHYPASPGPLAFELCYSVCVGDPVTVTGLVLNPLLSFGGVQWLCISPWSSKPPCWAVFTF